MTWNDFYDGFCDWSDSTVKTRISSLEDIGSGEEVVDVVLTLSDTKNKAQLVRKAMKLGVKFSHEDFVNLDGELPDELYAEVAKKGGFYFDNPYFDENNFDWDDFYAECADLPEEMLLRCIPRIRKFGDKDEIVEAILWLSSPADDMLYDRAIACGVKFTKAQLEEMGKDDSLLFVDDIKAFSDMSDSEIDEICRTAQKTADNAENMLKRMKQNKKRRKHATFWGVLLGLVAGASQNSRKKKKHDGRCDGDCASCPPHYGYRYGRWYYGHGHTRGCVFGGNKGGGGRD